MRSPTTPSPLPPLNDTHTGTHPFKHGSACLWVFYWASFLRSFAKRFPRMASIKYYYEKTNPRCLIESPSPPPRRLIPDHETIQGFFFRWRVFGAIIACSYMRYESILYFAAGAKRYYIFLCATVDKETLRAQTRRQIPNTLA